MAAEPGDNAGVLRLLAVAAVAIICTACAATRTTTPPTPDPETYEERGLASWYGNPHHGRRTANGEVFDMNAMTAAHRTLPFGTWLHVDNLATKRSVRVRINDRGPFVETRILDVSRAAAVALGALGSGVFPVRLRIAKVASVPAMDEPLRPLAGIDFRRVHVPLRIDGEVVNPVELSRTPAAAAEAAEHAARVAQQVPHDVVLAVGGMQERLRRVR